LVKPRLFDTDNPTRAEAQYVLNYVLMEAMKLLHPFMPFITEEIFQNLYNDSESIMISKWPEYKASWNFPEDAANMLFVTDAIRSVRNIRSEMNVPPTKKAGLIIITDEKHESIIIESKAYFERLAYTQGITFKKNRVDIPENAASAVIDGAEIFIPLNELIDLVKEIERLEKEKVFLEDELARVNGKLNNESFVSKAPAKVVQDEVAKKSKYQLMYEGVCNRLEMVKKL
jgi:valyl-tRNA synthetase